MKKYRVGVTLKDLVCSKYIHDTVQALKSENNIEIIIILDEIADRKSGWLSKIFHELRMNGALNSMSSLTFSLVQTIEGGLIYYLSNSARKHFEQKKVEPGEFIKCIKVKSFVSEDGIETCCNHEDLKALEQLDLDIIVNGKANTVYCGKILGVARLGVISLLLGDNRWNSGQPPAFWEVYKRSSSTGFTVQIFNEDQHEGAVLYRGEVITKRTYTENLVHVSRESNPFLALIVKKLLNHDKSIKAEVNQSVSRIFHKYPNVWQTANYILKSIVLYAHMFIEKKILQKDQRWGVAYSRKFWTDVELSEGKRIPNPKYRFLADPFVIKKNGKHHIFVEDYDCRRGLGAISCVVVNPDDSYEIIQNILVEPFHLSFPFIFEESGEIFMLPETYEGKGIRLYRCVEFPNKWELDTELLRGVSAADTMLIKRHDKWFMLTNMNQFLFYDHMSQLHVFWSDKLRSSDWKPLSPLPVVNSSKIGRNAGLLCGKNGDWFRVRQRQAFNQYGAGFSIAKITHLDLDGYSEETFAEIEPVFFDNLRGTHHMHGGDDFTVYDFVTAERYS
jgi:hypothetical protein